MVQGLVRVGDFPERLETPEQQTLFALMTDSILNSILMV